MSGPFFIFDIIRVVMYPHIASDAIIIIIIMALTTSPVFTLIIIVACELSSSVFVSPSVSSFATFIPEPKFDSLFFHFRLISNSFVSFPFKLSSVSNIPSGLVTQYSGAFTTSNPFGTISNTLVFPAIFTLFFTIILYFAITSAFFISDGFNSNFTSLLSFIGIFCPFTLTLLRFFSIEKSNTIFLFVNILLN